MVTRKNRSSLNRLFNKAEEFIVVKVVRNGLVHIIPVLIIGAFALVFQTFPVQHYQTFINNFLGGFLLRLFEIIYSATFGVLSIYMTYSISRSYVHLKSEISSDIVNGGAVVTSLISFFILSGSYLDIFSTEQMGPKSMFLAILTALLASSAYIKIYDILRRHRKNLFLTGGDQEFNRMIATLFPIMIVSTLFALFNTLIIRVSGVDSCRSLLINSLNNLFSYGSNGFSKGFAFVLLSSLLWFFGIHGSDTLEGVMQTYFTPGLAINQEAVASGNIPDVILTKGFFDCFVLMGGCGATICLLISILVFSRNRTSKGLGLAATFPMLFNINEMMVFGLPVILNPIMFIPFITVPLVSYSISYLAISLGIVPIITYEVAWTTPIILGGYCATGTIAGSLLQLTNVAIGVLIYTPFIKILDRQAEESAKDNYEEFISYFKKNEGLLQSIRIAELGNIYGDYAKDLCNDIRYSLENDVVLAYQPQYNYNNECIGVEALLRYEHPIIGMIYPPLVIKLAEDGGFLLDLEEKVLKKALEDRPKLLEKFGKDIKLSVNVTGKTVVDNRYTQFCAKINSGSLFEGQNICIEVTEQAALSFDDRTMSALKILHGMGIKLAIDDFSMGQTSIHYLQDGLFDIIKLDGSLVNGIVNNQNTREIITSIVKLAKNLNMTVLAEYVDTESKREELHNIGCNYYQGYLYSPAVFLDTK